MLLCSKCIMKMVNREKERYIRSIYCLIWLYSLWFMQNFWSGCCLGRELLSCFTCFSISIVIILPSIIFAIIYGIFRTCFSNLIICIQVAFWVHWYLFSISPFMLHNIFIISRDFLFYHGRAFPFLPPLHFIYTWPTITLLVRDDLLLS